MTTVDLIREARDLIPPPGATMAIAVHDGTHHRAAWLIDGRRKSAPVGPAFDKPRAAIAFVRLINGDPTPRSARVIPSIEAGTSPSLARVDEADPGRSEAPDGRSHRSPGGVAAGASPSPTPRSTHDPDLAGGLPTLSSRDEGRAPIEASDDEAIPRTRGIEPATLSDPAHEAAAGASPHPRAAIRG